MHFMEWQILQYMFGVSKVKLFNCSIHPKITQLSPDPFPLLIVGGVFALRLGLNGGTLANSKV